MARTRKTKAKGKVLKVDSADKIDAMESIVGKGSITFVLIYADWCGACTKFKKNIWNPMCEKSAAHSRVALRDDMVRNTSLASANFDYLPSLIVVDENGQMQSFKTPEGKHTNAMPTPQSLQEMNTIVNVPVGPLEPLGPVVPVNNKPVNNKAVNNKSVNMKPVNNKPVNMKPMNNVLEENPEIPLSNEAPLTLQMNEALTLTPSEPKGTLGKSYIPTPMVAPMKGGRRVSLKNITGMSKKVLKGLAGLFKRSRKRKPSRRAKASRKVKHSR